jgi:hypothetical protein
MPDTQFKITSQLLCQTKNNNKITFWSWNNTSNNESPILLIGGVHGDEPEGVWLAEALLIWLKSLEFKNQLESLNSFILVPCLNPDGFLKNERVNANGVDLNRNFPTPDWNKEYKADRYFPGQNPGSEIETTAIINLIEKCKPKLIIHFHSWQPCIIYTGDSAKNLAATISKITTYPSKDDIGYPTPGSLGQYGWFSKQTPVICFEELEGTPREQIWNRWQSILKLILFKKNLKTYFL